MTIRRVYLPLPLLVALFLAAGCANGGSGQSVGAPSSSAPVVPPAPAATSAVPTEESGATKPAAGAVQSLTGTVTAGVEPGCLLLDEHLLIMNDARQQAVAKAGARVTVTGRADEGVMTTCQQGTPFIVATVHAN
jgi:hypothetical protein